MPKNPTVVANSMRRVRELEAWSRPGAGPLPVDYGKDLQGAVSEAGVPEDVFVGISTIPDQTDIENLRLAIASGETTESAFIDFCRQNALLADTGAAESAARFLEQERGKCIAWIHLPEGAEPQMLHRIEAILRAYGHVIVDPDTGAEAAD